MCFEGVMWVWSVEGGVPPFDPLFVPLVIAEGSRDWSESDGGSSGDEEASEVCVQGGGGGAKGGYA